MDDLYPGADLGQRLIHHIQKNDTAADIDDADDPPGRKREYACPLYQSIR